jgi:hypothetical protein
LLLLAKLLSLNGKAQAESYREQHFSDRNTAVESVHWDRFRLKA